MDSREHLDKVKERIAKLLSMAADASSPNEAAIAAKRARALMDKYQLDEYDVSEAAPQEFADEAVTRAFSAVPYHIDVLAVAVARYNDCQSVFYEAPVTYKMESKANQNAKTGGGQTKKWGKKIVFRGYKNDVELAKQMLERLLDNIDKLCKEYMRENHPGRYSVRYGSEYKTQAARALCAKFKEMTVEREQLTCSTGTALVVAKAAAVDAKFGDPGYKTSSRSVQKATDWDDHDNMQRAREAGWKDGQKIEITKRLDE
jgi:hypothetical protein